MLLAGEAHPISVVTRVLLIPRLGFNLRSEAAVPIWWWFCSIANIFSLAPETS
jgi:hypothetical protein